MYYIRRLLMIILFLIATPLFAKTPETGKFISIADIHFDPFMGCTKKPCELIRKLNNNSASAWPTLFQKYSTQRLSYDGEDTDYFLLKSTLHELQKVNEQTHPEFVLILGDSLAHDFRERYRVYSGSKAGYANFVKKTLQFLTAEINKTFPTTDVYPAVGNNDSYTGDYSIFPNGAFFEETKYTWAPFLKNEHNKDSFQQTFGRGGYYAVNLPNHQQKIVILDTVLFARKVRGKNVAAAAEAQLKWLKEQLIEAQIARVKVMIAFHIPPDINISGAFKDNFGLIWKFWEATYWDEFKKIVKEYSENITAILPAHIHRDIFQFFTLGSFSKIPVNFTQSISPIFGNDPGFKVFSYSLPGFFITDVNTYTLDLGDHPAWHLGYRVSVENNATHNV